MSSDDVKKAFENAESVSDVDGAPTPDVESNTKSEFDDSLLREGAAFPLNDYGNGQRLMHYCGKSICFVPRLGWFCWDGQRWYSDEDSIEVRKFAQSIPKIIEDEVAAIFLTDSQMQRIEKGEAAEKKIDGLKLEDEGYSALMSQINDADSLKSWLAAQKKAHRSHAKTSGNTNRLSNMLVEAATNASVGVDALNSDPLMLNTQSGTLRFSKVIDQHDSEWSGEDVYKWTVEQLPHTPSHLISKICPVEYDPNSSCPNFIEFLSKVQPDPELRSFIQRWLGYSLTGLTTEQKLVFMYGGGRNGKSTLVDLVAKIVGDYGTSLPIETLTGTEQRKGSDATPDLVRLPGARFVRASEPEQGQKMKEALIKQLTGGEPILIRRMMKEFVEITPEFKLTISGNYKPEVRGADDGIWRRLLLVPWEVQIPKEDVDPDLPRKLWDERNGIFNWLVKGALDYLQNGLQEPAVVMDATEEYRQDSDPVRVFLQEECILTNDATDYVYARDLYAAFNAWMLDRGEAVWRSGTIARQFKSRADNFKSEQGYTYSHVKRSSAGYCRIKLTEKAEKRAKDEAANVSVEQGKN